MHLTRTRLQAVGHHSCSVARAAGVLAAVSLIASPAPIISSQSPSFKGGTSAVVLDVVVRDSRGKPVVDLRPGELTIQEDGVLRAVESLRLVGPSGTGIDTPPSSSPAAARPDVLQSPALVTLVFDHLTDNSRALARRAALQFVAAEMPRRQWVSVYRLDQRLYLAQSFTQDRDALSKAIMDATAAAGGARDRLSAGGNSDGAARTADAALGQLAKAGPPGDTGAIGAAVAEARVQEVIARMALMVETADLQQRGHATFFPLLALIKAQASLAGRKALLLFSEGLPIPADVEEAYRSTISEANRASVSIYAVDARGLATGRALEQSRQMLERSATNSQAQLVDGGSQRPVTLDDVMNPESAQGALRADTQNALRSIAEETGGELIANTNELGPGLLRRVREDLDSYYEVGYTPAPTPPDGRFRSIKVAVARKGVKVHARSGYFALPETDLAVLMPYELPMLTAAAAEPPPHPFEYTARVFQFESSPAGVQHTLVLEVPLEHLTFAENRREKTYFLRFTAMALIKDPTGRIVQRFSQSYPLQGPLERLPALKRGRLRFKRHFVIPPGTYTVSTIARDQATERSSVKLLPVDVRAPASSIRMSDITLVRSVEQTGEAADAVEDPFRTGTMRLVPNLDLPISKRTNSQISSYVTVYPDRAQGVPGLSFEFIRDGVVIGRSAAEPPAADESGRIKYVASFPTQSFAPGAYELRAVATQGTSTCSAQTAFVIIP